MAQELLIKNARQLLTMQGSGAADLGVVEQGWLWASDGVIRAVGTRAQVEPLLPPAAALTVIDAADKTVLPGFVDCHTHVMFGGSRVAEYAVKVVDDDPQAVARAGIKTGIYASVEMTQTLPVEELKQQTSKRLCNMLLHGTTTVESKSGYGLTLESELKMLRLNRELNAELPLDIRSCFLGAHGWAQDMSKQDYMRHLCQDMLPAVAAEQLAEYCDVWCDEGHYTAEESRVILEAGEKYGLIPRIHTDAYSYIGGSDLAVSMHMASADHLNYTPRHLFPQLAAAGVVGVVLPGIEFAVKHPLPMNPRPMLDAGMTLALATNCCPGVWAESMQFILILASRIYGMSAEEAIRAATAGGAAALRLPDRGVLAAGKRADLQLWDVDTYQDVIYKYGRNNVQSVIVNGRVVAEDGRLV